MAGLSVREACPTLSHMTDLCAVPRGVIDEGERSKAYSAAIEFMSKAHKSDQ
jgi:hypothetical protein